MTDISSEVRRHLSVGNHYAKHGLCTRSIECYALALDGLLQEPAASDSPEAAAVGTVGAFVGKRLTIDSELIEALVNNQPETVSLSCDAEHLLVKLHAALPKGIGNIDTASHATLFRPSKQFSIVVFHGVQDKEYGTLRFPIPDPTATTQAFIVRDKDSTLEVIDDKGGRRALLAYTIGHMADVRLRSMVALNEHGPVFMLSDSNLPLYQQCMGEYRHSLYLDPTRAWTWSHWAEAHRNRGCSWIGGIDAIMMSEQRAHAYIEAMVRYQVALDLDPNSWWINAHYGAAVVNARAFLSFTGGANKCTDAAVSAWLAEQQDLDIGAHGGPSQALLAKGAQMLETSQELQGHYYPWAEVYQGDVHLIRSLIIQGEAGRFLGIVSMLETNAGFYHDPDLPKRIMDPGAPYVNGFFQAALVYYWTRDLNPDNLMTAWAFAILGVRRTLNFNFNIELYILYACQILVNIAHAMITEEGHTSKDILAHLAHRTTSRFPVDIRQEILQDKQALIAFVHQITDRVGLPAASSADHQKELETKDRQALIQTLQILEELKNLLHGLGSSHKPLDELIASIETRLDSGKAVCA